MTSIQLDGTVVNDQRENKLYSVITRNGDHFSPTSLLVRNVSDNYKLKEINFKIGSSTIYSFESHLFESFPELEERCSNNSIRYRFPSQLGLDEVFKLVALQYSEVRCEFKFYGTCDRAKLFGKYVYYTTDERRQIALANHNVQVVIPQFQECFITNPSARTISERILCNHLTNGYYVTGISPSDIDRLELKINGSTRCDWEEDEIAEYVESRGNGMYIPLNDQPFRDFSQALNQSRMDNIQLSFTLKSNINLQADQSFGIWCYVWNYVNISSGMAGLRFGGSVLTSPPTTATAPATQETVRRPITDPEYICPISLEPIAQGANYHMCHQCNRAFSQENFTSWLSRNNSCPLCRCRGQNLSTVYVNQAEGEEAPEQPQEEETPAAPAAPAAPAVPVERFEEVPQVNEVVILPRVISRLPAFVSPLSFSHRHSQRVSHRHPN